ncbi:hypothetical protein Tcan_07145, partial [Toxocara canis]
WLVNCYALKCDTDKGCTYALSLGTIWVTVKRLITGMPHSKSTDKRLLAHFDTKHLNDVLTALRTTHTMISKSLKALNEENQDFTDPRVIWKITNLYSQAAVQLDTVLSFSFILNTYWTR